MSSTGTNEDYARSDLVPHYFCNRCYNTIYGDEKRCSDCGKIRPQNGFPDIESSLDPWLGRIIADRYFVSKRVGRGGTGSVYRVQAMPYGRSLAVKIVDFANLPADTPVHTLEKRLEREVVALRKLQSPHIVQLYEVLDLPDNVVGVVMDFIKGRTLDQIIDSCGALPPSRALNIVRQIAEGVYDAHKAGMIHRDLKPENIMIERFEIHHDFVNILDFGVVRIDDGLRLTHGFLGTPLYASPEQAMAREVDNRTDIYSLGAILFYVLTGHPPFEYDSIFEILQAHTRADLPTLEEAAGHPFHPKLEALVRRLLSKERDHRPSTLAEVSEVIDELLELDLEDLSAISTELPSAEDLVKPIVFPKIHELDESDPIEEEAISEPTEDPLILEGTTLDGSPLEEISSERRSLRFNIKSYDHRPGNIDDILDSLEPDDSTFPVENTEPSIASDPKHPTLDEDSSEQFEFTSHWGQLERIRLHSLEPAEKILDFSSSHDATSLSLLFEGGKITEINWQGKISRATVLKKDALKVRHYHADIRDAVSLCDDVNQFLVGTSDGRIYALSKEDHSLDELFVHASESPVTQLAAASSKFSRRIATFENGDLFAAGDGIGQLKAGGTHGESSHPWTRLFENLSCEVVAIAKNGESFATIEQNQGLKIYSFATPAAPFASSPLSGRAIEAIFSQDGHVVALLRDDSIIELRHTISGSKLTTLYDPEHCLRYVSFGSDGGFLGYFIQNRQLWAIDLQREMIRST